MLARCLAFDLRAGGGCLTAAESFQEIQSRITSFTLKNGMTFVVMERHQAPVATFPHLRRRGQRAGGQGHHGPGAHLRAHRVQGLARHRAARTTRKSAWRSIAWTRPSSRCATSGTRARRPTPQKLKELEAAFQAAQEGAGKFVVKNEYGDAIERTGGRDMNAGTGWDSTRYFFSLPSNSAELWFFLESEHFLRPVMREFYKEKDVVMEERRMRTESQPIGKLLEESAARRLQGAPLRRAGGGPHERSAGDHAARRRGVLQEILRAGQPGRA